MIVVRPGTVQSGQGSVSQFRPDECRQIIVGNGDRYNGMVIPGQRLPGFS